MPSTIGKCKLFRIKHITLLEGETFLRNKHDIAFFEINCTFFGRKENTISLFVRCHIFQILIDPVNNVLHATQTVSKMLQTLEHIQDKYWLPNNLLLKHLYCICAKHFELNTQIAYKPLNHYIFQHLIYCVWFLSLLFSLYIHQYS